MAKNDDAEKKTYIQKYSLQRRDSKGSFRRIATFNEPTRPNRFNVTMVQVPTFCGELNPSLQQNGRLNLGYKLV